MLCKKKNERKFIHLSIGETNETNPKWKTKTKSQTEHVFFMNNTDCTQNVRNARNGD